MGWSLEYYAKSYRRGQESYNFTHILDVKKLQTKRTNSDIDRIVVTIEGVREDKEGKEGQTHGDGRWLDCRWWAHNRQ